MQIFVISISTVVSIIYCNRKIDWEFINSLAHWFSKFFFTIIICLFFFLIVHGASRSLRQLRDFWNRQRWIHCKLAYTTSMCFLLHSDSVFSNLRTTAITLCPTCLFWCLLRNILVVLRAHLQSLNGKLFRQEDTDSDFKFTILNFKLTMSTWQF